MALTTVERQQRYRNKLRKGELSRIDIKLPVDTANKLGNLAEHWQCTKTEALSRCLDDAWERVTQPAIHASWPNSDDHIATLADTALLPDDLTAANTHHTQNTSSKPAHALIYQIRLTLIGVTPTVWRRLLVPVDTNIKKLHNIVQTAMGWEDYHLHRFMIFGGEYGISQAGGVSFHDNPNEVLLSGFNFQLGDSFYYEYDFGDMWEHELIIEDILDRELRKTYPVCIDGKRACPPEDTGGPGGYMYMLHVLKCKRHRDKRAIKEQIGSDFNPARFRRGEVNSELKRCQQE